MQMPLPTPTDNLYKFMALAGVATVILVLVFAFRRIEQYRAAYLEAQLGLVEAGVRDLDAAPTTMPADPAAAKAYLRRQAVLDEAGEFVGFAPQVAYVLAGGLLVAGTGFWLWYWRTQRHADELLKLEVQGRRGEAAR